MASYTKYDLSVQGVVFGRLTPRTGRTRNTRETSTAAIAVLLLSLNSERAITERVAYLVDGAFAETMVKFRGEMAAGALSGRPQSLTI
jgi:hypothetical protein